MTDDESWVGLRVMYTGSSWMLHSGVHGIVLSEDDGYLIVDIDPFGIACAPLEDWTLV